ncbi:galactose-1-phosphate uridylyltransferase [Sporocytophaga myxococcoides]|uniref:galactose-1-phosphate uridylyltransferase n=1 Tax=Sporocytophaga myxococcoides TaxID=153721 RepID=UPI000429B450|nr:galactose-1-phosphate uridylyltransferase [Sporocytophaga myxococcoides]
MNHLRWNPLLKTYTLIATNRIQRPIFPDECPFCPGSGKIKDTYDVLYLPNEFPVLSNEFKAPIQENGSFFKSGASYGQCEVILYSPDHFATLYDLENSHVEKLIKLWRDRSLELSKNASIEYIHIFENRGQEVGSSIHHPHGQIYGYPFIPLKLKTELDSCKEYFLQTNKNLILELNAQEESEQKRIITSNKSFLAYIPYFAEHPLGVFISSRRQKSFLTDFTNEEITDLAMILKDVTGALDAVYKKPLPYTMSIHQAPHKSKEYFDNKNYYSLHIEFSPVLKDASNVKFHGGSEMGAWANISTKPAEESAEILRNALQIFKKAGR